MILMQLIKAFFKSVYSSRSTSQNNATDLNNAMSTNSTSGDASSYIDVLWSLTNALFIPGGMIGSLFGGWMADKFGRLVDNQFQLTART
jgi:uncharacterized membrane protein YfcA